MEEILRRIKYSIFLLFFLLFCMCLFFVCCVQCGLFPFQTKEGFVYSKALAVLLGRLHDYCNNLQPQTYLNFCKCGLRERLFWASRCQKEKGWGERGCFIIYLFFFNQVAPMLFVLRPLKALHTSHRAVSPFPFSIIFLSIENTN